MPHMRALRFKEPAKELKLETDVPIPTPEHHEALIKISRAAICSTDLHILNGYVTGFNNTLGHEFIGIVEESPSDSSLIGKRVVGEINCRCGNSRNMTHPDPIFIRNHAPERTVLGIIGKDGCIAEYCTLPIENLHLVPDEITDREAVFAEPLAAACRIVEQSLVQQGDKVAVVGDGKLGLLVAQVLVVHGFHVTFFGRHQRKLGLVEGIKERVILPDKTVPDAFKGAFDVTVEASGSPAGISQALELTRPLGAIVVKSTCSLNDREMPSWSLVGNDVVVNEKKLIGSRCGPFPEALKMLENDKVRSLVHSMVDAETTLDDGVQAMEKAGTKGTLKVQIVMV